MRDVAGQAVKRSIVRCFAKKVKKALDGWPSLALSDHRIGHDGDAGIGAVGEDLIKYLGAY
ncbi:hypothetical protein [Mesorhizobium sp. 2RAF21]|uniref:hypothetical protein n=1 Tax=Mesorhizobium sp. 2RAF21 TaxID=3232995 RepID=UPI003F9E863C